jgi:hypothetical protein
MDESIKPFELALEEARESLKDGGIPVSKTDILQQ